MGLTGWLWLPHDEEEEVEEEAWDSINILIKVGLLIFCVLSSIRLTCPIKRRRRRCGYSPVHANDLIEWKERLSKI